MLGSLETEVLAALRELREAPAKRVREQLSTRGVAVAYTTVATILTRLWAKGLVQRRREPCQGGERYVYRYRDIEHRYIQTLLRRVVALFGPSGVIHLNEAISKLRPAEERALRRRLRL